MLTSFNHGPYFHIHSHFIVTLIRVKKVGNAHRATHFPYEDPAKPDTQAVSTEVRGVYRDFGPVKDQHLGVVGRAQSPGHRPPGGAQRTPRHSVAKAEHKRSKSGAKVEQKRSKSEATCGKGEAKAEQSVAQAKQSVAYRGKVRHKRGEARQATAEPCNSVANTRTGRRASAPTWSSAVG